MMAPVGGSSLRFDGKGGEPQRNNDNDHRRSSGNAANIAERDDGNDDLVVLLSDDLRVRVLSFLDVDDVRSVGEVWSSIFGPSSKPAIWYALAHEIGLEGARAKERKRRRRASLRSGTSANARASFLARWEMKKKMEAEANAVLLWDLWFVIFKGDAASQVKATLESYSGSGGCASELVSTGLATHLGQTLLHVAAMNGRMRCVKLLVQQYDAPIDARDDGSFTPLLAAAWSADRVQVVEYLVERGASIEAKGVPPLTSSCGGYGPFSAKTWAKRKGHRAVYAYLKALE